MKKLTLLKTREIRKSAHFNTRKLKIVIKISENELLTTNKINFYTILLQLFSNLTVF